MVRGRAADMRDGKLDTGRGVCERRKMRCSARACHLTVRACGAGIPSARIFGDGLKPRPFA
jgi:hypothetical protein